MGTIAQKLEYLNDTRLLLKDNINKINNVLDDNSTFRSYPQELFNGYLDILNNGTDTLWNNLEKVSASGEEATLENVETAPIKMVLNGNTSQDTTTGKNLFTTDYLTSNSFTTYTKLTDNSFSFTATGTWKKASYKVPCKPNTNYYFNFSSTSSMYIQIRGVQTGTQIIAVYQAYLTTFNSGENTELQINIDIGQNSIASVTISDIQLEEGTTATSFEKYTGGQPSPSPDYPQEVKVVKGENVVSVQGKNLAKTDYPINLGDIELCKINTYKDYFHKDSGKWYVHKEIGKVVLDGTQTISSYNTSSTNTTRVSYHNLVTNMVGVVTLLCNMLPQKNNWNNDTEGISYNAQNRDIWFRISKSTIGTTQTETNSFLATNNMIIYYVLATPTEEEITNSTLIEQLEAISKAKSVKDKTYITQTNDELPFILDVEAIKEYEVN